MPSRKVNNLNKKHRKSNQARLNSLALVHEQSQKSKLLVQTALNNLDTYKKHHIKFTDSDEDEGFQSNEFSSEKSKSDSVLGFDNDSEEITISPYVGKKSAQKLMQIRSNVGLDDRFQFDDRFVDYKDDDNEEACINEDVSSEVKKNLAILQQVVGITTLSKLSKHKSHHFEDPSAKRYDPAQDKHLNVESSAKTLQPEVTKKKKKKKEISIPEVDKQQFYEVSSTGLQKAFGKNKQKPHELNTDNDSNKTFSILGMLGRQQEDDDKDKNEASDYKAESYNKKDKINSKLLNSHLFKDDDSESGHSDEEKLDIEALVDKSVIDHGQPKTNAYFLFSKSDIRILDGPKRFCSNKTYETIHREWEEVKDELQSEYKYKHKNAVRIKKKQVRQKKE